MSILLTMMEKERYNTNTRHARKVIDERKPWCCGLLAVILRASSGLLRALTTSYSTDIVYALAITGMAVHCFEKNDNDDLFFFFVTNYNNSVETNTLCRIFVSEGSVVLPFIIIIIILHQRSYSYNNSSNVDTNSYPHSDSSSSVRGPRWNYIIECSVFRNCAADISYQI